MKYHRENSMDKKQIYVKFEGFARKSTGENNQIYRLLSKSYNLILSETPDFFFYASGTLLSSINDPVYKDCVKIFLTGEMVSPDFNVCDYAIGFDYIEFGDRYIRHNMEIPYNTDGVNTLPISMAHRDFCNFIYRNTGLGENTTLRMEFCKKLMEYKTVACPGQALNNMENAIEPREGNWHAGKLDFIKNYKFTIAFENASCFGYITEKLKDPLMMHSIPIYFGDPSVTREFNPKAFINCHDFDSFDDVIEYVKYLDNNDEAYMEMLRQPPMQVDYNYAPQKLERFLINIIEKGKKPYSKDPLGFGKMMRSTPPQKQAWEVRMITRLSKSIRKRLPFVKK